MTELSLAKKWVNKRWVGFVLGVLFMMAVAALYEIIEWIYAVNFGGDRGIDFFGNQGDIWDAQKDMALDTLGAFFSLGIWSIFSRKK